MGGQNGVCPVVGSGGELWRGTVAGGPGCSLTSLGLLRPVVCGAFGIVTLAVRERDGLEEIPEVYGLANPPSRRKSEALAPPAQSQQQ